MKTCLVNGCSLPRFGSGYCKRHQYLRTDKKEKRAKPTSLKRAKENERYTQICNEIDEEALLTGHTECVFCGSKITEKQWIKRTHHHLFGRVGKLLYDKELIRLAHFECHDDYHHKSVSLLPWWSGYVERIRNIEGLYLKEKRREEKEQYHAEQV